MDLYVVHLAKTSKGRSKIGNFDESLHKYPYKILYASYIEDFNIVKKSLKVLKELMFYKPDVLITAGYNDISILLSAFVNKILNKKTFLQLTLPIMIGLAISPKNL